MLICFLISIAEGDSLLGVAASGLFFLETN